MRVLLFCFFLANVVRKWYAVAQKSIKVSLHGVMDYSTASKHPIQPLPSNSFVFLDWGWLPIRVFPIRHVSRKEKPTRLHKMRDQAGFVILLSPIKFPLARFPAGWKWIFSIRVRRINSCKSSTCRHKQYERQDNCCDFFHFNCSFPLKRTIKRGNRQTGAASCGLTIYSKKYDVRITPHIIYDMSKPDVTKNPSNSQNLNWRE